MYTLLLTSDERKAFDWVGNRYNAGEVASLLTCDCVFAGEWEDSGEITFLVPEWVAWEIHDYAHSEGFAWPCFADPLKDKLNSFCDNIV